MGGILHSKGNLLHRLDATVLCVNGKIIPQGGILGEYMKLPVVFTDEERQANSNVRRKWFDVEEDSLPEVFYLPLYQPMSASTSAIYSTPIQVRVARYERIHSYPYAAPGQNVYAYKGDEYK